MFQFPEGSSEIQYLFYDAGTEGIHKYIIGTGTNISKETNILVDSIEHSSIRYRGVAGAVSVDGNAEAYVPFLMIYLEDSG